MNKRSETGVSIIVPTYQEAKNLPELVQRLAKVNWEEKAIELLIMDDDSQDGTVEVVRGLQAHYPWVELVVRKGERSLSLSVIEGFQRANYPLLVTMDADLSHPPEKIPEMLNALMQPSVDFVIGSRYVPEGTVDAIWPRSRYVASWCAAMLARFLLTSNVHDPLSGFLALRKTTFSSGGTLDPIGWKIGLELMVKCHCKAIREVPIDFAERHHGVSKLNLKVVMHFLKHLARLFKYKFLQKK